MATEFSVFSCCHMHNYVICEEPKRKPGKGIFREGCAAMCNGVLREQGTTNLGVWSSNLPRCANISKAL